MIIDGTNGLTFNDATTQTKAGLTGSTSQLCKAWVNCSSTTINGSYNVSSITLPTTGRFQINFTTAMPNANYAVIASGAPASDIAMYCYTAYQVNWGTNSTTACFVTTVNQSGPNLINPANLYVAVFSS
jgi:hypothetical protein